MVHHPCIVSQYWMKFYYHCFIILMKYLKCQQIRKGCIYSTQFQYFSRFLFLGWLVSCSWCYCCSMPNIFHANSIILQSQHTSFQKEVCRWHSVQVPGGVYFWHLLTIKELLTFIPFFCFILYCPIWLLCGWKKILRLVKSNLLEWKKYDLWLFYQKQIEKKHSLFLHSLVKDLGSFVLILTKSNQFTIEFNFT